MKYLKELFNVKIENLEDQRDIYKLNYHIRSFYKVRVFRIGGRKMIFIKPNGVHSLEMKQINFHFKKFRRRTGMPLVLLLDEISEEEKKFYIENRIFFMVKNSFVFIPILGVYLQGEAGVSLPPVREFKSGIFTPDEQVLFLHYLFSCPCQTCIRISLDLIDEYLKIGKDRLQKALNGLVGYGFFEQKISKGEVFIFSKKTPEFLFKVFLGYLGNPIKRRIVIHKKYLPLNAVKSGLDALSYYTGLNTTNFYHMEHYAVDNIDKVLDKRVPKNYDSKEYCMLEEWHYSPLLLNNGFSCVDRLSLALTLLATNFKSGKKELNFEIKKLIDDVLTGFNRYDIAKNKNYMYLNSKSCLFAGTELNKI